jgi:hypothetical protein
MYRVWLRTLAVGTVLSLLAQGADAQAPGQPPVPRFNDQLMQERNRFFQQTTEAEQHRRALKQLSQRGLPKDLQDRMYRRANPTWFDQAKVRLSHLLCMGTLGILGAAGAALKRLFGGAAASSHPDTPGGYP